MNAGFIVGHGITLIVDTGACALAAGTIGGYASAAKPEHSLRVINTEKHFDHIGGNSYFRQRAVEIWGHANVSRTTEEFDAEIAEFNSAIENPARRSREEAKVFFSGTVLAVPDHLVESAMPFDVGGLSAEILLTPGHTNSNLSVWVPEDGVLFSGDCLVNGYLPNLDAGAPEDWRTWLESIHRIEALRPAVVVVGHGPVARGEQVDRIIGDVRQILKEAIRTGRSPTQVEP